MLKAPVIQLAGAFCNIKFTLISTLWYNGLVVFYRYKNGYKDGYKENIVLINQTAKKILKALSFDGVEVEAFRHMADLKRLDPMKIFYKKIDTNKICIYFEVCVLVIYNENFLIRLTPFWTILFKNTTFKRSPGWTNGISYVSTKFIGTTIFLLIFFSLK